MRDYNDDYSAGERVNGSAVDAYIYKDESGAPYLRVVRQNTKNFPQYHLEGDQWVKGKPKGPKIPYHLPELIAAPPITPNFICEGEKDADNVAGLGLITTTNSEGASPGKWTPDLNKWFLGKQTVYILEDNDDTGRDHANEVADNLRDIVKEIRIVDFPELPEHGDVSDWLDQGYTKEQLLARAKKGRAPDGWPEPLNFFSDQGYGREMPPLLAMDHIPEEIYSFAVDTAGRMGVDPVSVALGCITVCAAVISDSWRIQPKRYDYTWTENARIWAAIVGDPSIIKSPVLRACIKPITSLDIDAREKYRSEMVLYKKALAAAKKEKTEEPPHPQLARHMVENISVETISEVLRSDGGGTQYAPAGKILVYQDEIGIFREPG